MHAAVGCYRGTRPTAIAIHRLANHFAHQGPVVGNELDSGDEVGRVGFSEKMFQRFKKSVFVIFFKL